MNLNSKQVVEESEQASYERMEKYIHELESQLKAKDQTISSLMDAQDAWISERADLQAVIERLGDRVRYLETQLQLHYEE